MDIRFWTIFIDFQGMCGELLNNALCLLLSPRTCLVGLDWVCLEKWYSVFFDVLEAHMAVKLHLCSKYILNFPHGALSFLKKKPSFEPFPPWHEVVKGESKILCWGCYGKFIEGMKGKRFTPWTWGCESWG